MSVINSEFEVSSSLPADKLFKLDFDTLAPKIQPQAFKAIDLIEGDGGVGSIKRVTYSDAVPYTSAKYKIDDIDASNFSATYTVFEGDEKLGIPATHHYKIVPSADGGAVFKDSVVFKRKDAMQRQCILLYISVACSWISLQTHPAKQAVGPYPAQRINPNPL
nr:root allergen protein-like [Tanacetum cinerariifolium]